MKAFGITHKGSVRQDNQDRFRLRQTEEGKGAVLVLCDGMGGAASGALAAQMAADAFMTHVELCLSEDSPPSCAVIAKESAAYANIRVYDKAHKDEACRGMGTTLVGFLCRGEDTALVNVGDSRCYLYRDKKLTQLTKDHSLVEELVRQGTLSPEEAQVHPRRNIITRAIGLEYRVKADIYQPKLQEGDRLLLCSDGLSNTLEKGVMETVLATEPEPEGACRALLHLALLQGAGDNVTVVVFCR